MPSPGPADHLSLVLPIARAVQARFHGLAELKELLQLGMLGLLQATPDIDPARSETSARAYLRLRIWGAMLDPMRRECQRQQISQDCDRVFPAPQPARSLGGALKRLSLGQRRVLDLRLQGYTQVEVGDAFHLSQSRVSRIEAAAVIRLRHLLN